MLPAYHNFPVVERGGCNAAFKDLGSRPRENHAIDRIEIFFFSFTAFSL
jgi:hypothetical protein